MYPPAGAGGVATLRVEVPVQQKGALYHRHPEHSLPPSATVVVDDGDVAVLTSSGRALGQLGPGTHALSPASAPFLASVVDPASGAVDAEVHFLRTTPVSALPVGGPVGKLTDSNGNELAIAYQAKLSFVVRDPAKAALAFAHVRGDPVERVKQLVGRGLLASVVRLEKRGEVMISSLARAGRAVAEDAKTSELGLGDLGIDVLGLDGLELTRQAPGAEPAAAARPLPGPAPAGAAPPPAAAYAPPGPAGAPHAGGPHAGYAAAPGVAPPGPPAPPPGPSWPGFGPQQPAAAPAAPRPAAWPGFGPAGAAAAGAVGAAAAAPAAAGAAELRFTLPGILYSDHQARVDVRANLHGVFVGAPVPESHTRWLIDTLGQAMAAIARDYSGPVLDVDQFRPQLAEALTQAVAPVLAQGGLQGHVVVVQVELPANDPGVQHLVALRQHGRY
ncbi:MAG: hypothetical protein IT376_04815 [Polyangiaceae bacterium]|nr:hypothetical protein [Polyangiaceae bacterium]